MTPGEGSSWLDAEPARMPAPFGAGVNTVARKHHTQTG